MISNSRIIHVNSRDRTSGADENFTYSFNLSPDEHYTHCCVLQASVPVSYYLIQDGYNTMTLKEGVATATITVPPGNDNTNSCMTVVAELLNSGSPNGWTYAITMNNSFTSTNNGLMYFSVSGNSSQPEFILTTNMYEQFGFNANSTNVFVGNALTSTNVVNFIPEQTLYIYSDLVKNRSNNGKGVLQEIFASNQVAIYQCIDIEAYSKEINNNKTNSFSIILQNEDQNTI